MDKFLIEFVYLIAIPVFTSSFIQISPEVIRTDYAPGWGYLPDLFTCTGDSNQQHKS